MIPIRMWFGRRRAARKIDSKRFLRIGGSAFVNLGLASATAFFTFQTAQSWVDEKTHSAAFRWAFPLSTALVAFSVYSTLFLLYHFVRGYPSRTSGDQYSQFVAGVVAYGELLHKEKRDPALLRLRNNETLTLHVLGFHAERSRLGTWALESAQYIDDKLSIVSILIDDLGWAKYLVNDRAGRANIVKALEYAEGLSPGFGDPNRTILQAKGHRHLGVIKSAEDGDLAVDEFAAAEKLLLSVQHLDPRIVRIELAHVRYAQAHAIAAHLEVNIAGKVRRSDVPGTVLLREALSLVREARDSFQREGDQGRYAKSLVLEVRLLEALGELDHARQLAPVRDRAVAGSVWCRPDGRLFMTGR